MTKIISCICRALFVLLLLRSVVNAQSPSPETAATLFPKGALLSYGSDFYSRDFPPAGDQLTPTSQPTFAHHGNFVFTWGFYPNFDFTIRAPIVTNRFVNQAENGGTDFGDLLALVKHRVFRSDSRRGTSQISITGGVEFATGSTDVSDSAGKTLPASMQPGSGSTDLFLGANWTYTGLFNIRRLVLDEDFQSLIRTTGTQNTNLGNNFESRLWISYRPYESQDVQREWFIGPSLAWLHTNDEKIAGIFQQGSGGDVLLAGLTTYVGVAAGMHVWLALAWDVAHSDQENFSPVQRRISFGITRQFRLF